MSIQSDIILDTCCNSISGAFDATDALVTTAGFRHSHGWEDRTYYC